MDGITLDAFETASTIMSGGKGFESILETESDVLLRQPPMLVGKPGGDLMNCQRTERHHGKTAFSSTRHTGRSTRSAPLLHMIRDIESQEAV